MTTNDINLQRVQAGMAGYFKCYAMNSHYRSCLGVGVGAEGAAVDGAPLAHRGYLARGHEQPVVGCLMIGSFMRIADAMLFVLDA